MVSRGPTGSHLVSLRFIGFHLCPLSFTWFHLVSLGLTWSHLDSLGLTWSHLDSLGLALLHFGPHWMNTPGALKKIANIWSTLPGFKVVALKTPGLSIKYHRFPLKRQCLPSFWMPKASKRTSQRDVRTFEGRKHQPGKSLISRPHTASHRKNERNETISQFGRATRTHPPTSDIYIHK